MDPSDQNAVTSIVSTLGSLSNNGGYVPTMALLDGSPALDAGVTAAGLTTDARGIARPQGVAYDSGAYERVVNSGNQDQDEPGESDSSLADTGSSQSITALLSSALLLAGILTLHRVYTARQQM
jgi:hypothetical protein